MIELVADPEPLIPPPPETVFVPLSPTSLSMQADCTTGKPCGDTCLDADEECHVGPGSLSSSSSSSTAGVPVSITPIPASIYQLKQGSLQGPILVQRVIDGNTIIIRVNGRNENARLIGIDTLETKPLKRGVEPLGAEAKRFATGLLYGRLVYIQFGAQERDQYHRPLVYVYFKDPTGLWEYGNERLTQANLAIVEAGYAQPLTIAPNILYSGLYVQAAEQARLGKLGMWVAAE